MAAPARQMTSALPAALPARRPRRSAPARHRHPSHPKRHQTRRIVRGTANVVTHLPETSAVHGMTRHKVWIAVIGVLLIGIVAINVLTVSYGSMASNIEADIATLERRNAILESSEVTALSMPRVRNAALAAGMAVPEPQEIKYLSFKDGDIAAAAARLAAEGG